MITAKRRFGDEGERIAEAHLRALGFRIVARQQRMGRWGEIDLIALDGGTLVFVEVKTRSSGLYGSPEEAVTAAKRRTLARAVAAYRQSRGLEAVPFRADVVAVDRSGPVPRIRHLRDVSLE